MSTEVKFPVLEIEPDPTSIEPKSLPRTIEEKLIASLEAHIETLKKENEFLRGELAKKPSQVPHIPTVVPRPMLRTTSEIQKALEKFYALKDPKFEHVVREEEK